MRPDTPNKTSRQFTLPAILGCLLGGAIGDSLGSSFEGKDPCTSREVSIGQLTDDTQLTLATSEALAATGTVSPPAIAAAMLKRFREGKISGVGSSTLTALRGLHVGGHWALVGRRGEHAAGGGAAMRIAPLAFFLDPVEHEDRRRCRDVCRITHHHEEAFCAALAVLIAIRSAARGDLSVDTIETLVERLPDSRTRDVLDELSNAPPASIAEAAAKTGTSGYAPAVVPLAIFSATSARLDFTGTMTEIIRLGGDTDTVASIAGQISGAHLGVDGLPRKFIDALPCADYISGVGRRLYECIRVERPRNGGGP